MASPNRTTAKRRIERIHNRVVHVITDSVTNTILHTFEDRKTLVRTIVKGTICLNSAGLNDVAFNIAREPHGVAVASPAVSESLDDDAYKEQIIDYTACYPAGFVGTLPIDIDSKGMRKFDAGDEITLRDVGAVANGARIAVHISLFFKE